MTRDDNVRPSGSPLLEVLGVVKSFGKTRVLDGLSLETARGEVVCIMGSSGSGKTTLLRCINNLESVDRGVILVDGELIGCRREPGGLRELSPRQAAANRRHVGMVFQQFNLFPHMTALENVTLAPRKVAHLSNREAREVALPLLERVGMAERADAYPYQLSGGQQQRVAIARALAMRPKLMLFDEPTSALDPELVGEVLAAMKSLAADGMTMLCATHEITFARDVADTVVFLSEGRLIESGPAREVLSSPRDTRTKKFLARVM